MLKMCDSDDSDEEVSPNSMVQEKSIYTFPKRRNSRRKSSIGAMSASKMAMNPVEQARVIEMYKTVIQMSSENKLNEKNSWNYDLIDHMGGLIKDESRGVNFQKASCTLDASVKIYSNRVDDTYTSSHRILESLSRNGNNGDDNDDKEGEDGDDDDNEGSGGKRKAKVGSKASSTRLNIAATIERNPTSLNLVKLENDYAVDPMFHKISKAFDEGGAKGMLMNNLRTSTQGCALSFHFKDAVCNQEAASDSGAANGQGYDDTNTSIADALARFSTNVAELSDSSLCPALDVYRERMGLPTSSVSSSSSIAAGEIPKAGCLDAVVQMLDSLVAAAGPTTATAGAAFEGGMNGDLDDWVDANNCEDDNFGASGLDDNGADGFPESPSIAAFGDQEVAAAVTLSPISSDDSSECNKLRWDDDGPAAHAADIGDANPASGSAGGLLRAADMEALTQGMEYINLAGPAEYSYFNTNAIFSSSNAWAGARHWKYASTRKRVAAVAAESGASSAAAAASTASSGDGGVEDGEESVSSSSVAPNQRKRSGKQGGGKSKSDGYIDFSADLVDESQFALPVPAASSSKSKKNSAPIVAKDSTLQTSAALEKQASSSSALFLPPDAKVQVKDLCRLYLVPHVLVPASVQQRAILAQQRNTAGGNSAHDATVSKIDRFLCGQAGSERVWGLTGPGNVPTAGGVVGSSGARLVSMGEHSASEAVTSNAYHDFEDDDEYGGGYGDDVDDFAPMGSSDGGGDDSHRDLAINQANLVQADRKVEKIEISYAKVSKRVNIQRLKKDIWSSIRSSLPNGRRHGEEEEEEAASIDGENLEPSNVEEEDNNQQQQQPCKIPAAQSQTLSFQGMIGNVVQKQMVEQGDVRQKDVTLPFYFICLLHLANEHTLKIEDRPDMSDLIITMDQK